MSGEKTLQSFAPLVEGLRGALDGEGKRDAQKVYLGKR